MPCVRIGSLSLVRLHATPRYKRDAPCSMVQLRAYLPVELKKECCIAGPADMSPGTSKRKKVEKMLWRAQRRFCTLLLDYIQPNSDLHQNAKIHDSTELKTRLSSAWTSKKRLSNLSLVHDRPTLSWGERCTLEQLPAHLAVLCNRYIV